jgi:enamine deaminase RidA (YjgF/YER057c/UK114 family)
MVNIKAGIVMTIEEKLKELSITLPAAPTPMGAYVPYVKAGNMVYIAGEKATVNDELVFKGKVGSDLTLDEGYKAARIAGLNCLGSLKAAVGDLDSIERIVKVVGYVNSAVGFNQQPQVINGASELLLEIFGNRGKHARVAVGVNELPSDSPVEVEMIALLKS